MKQSLRKYVCLIIGFIIPITVISQGLKTGDKVQNLPILKILNSSPGYKTLNELPKKLTVLDFFGTWCMPCVKALPHLSSLASSYHDDLQILLVSDETEAKLTKFINARKNLRFPVIVDADSRWNNIFMPPSLPYTVILNSTGNVVKITTAEDITASMIDSLLLAPKTISNDNNTMPEMSKSQAGITNKKSSDAILQLSQDYIYSAKTGESLDELNKQLRDLDYVKLLSSLKDDNKKKAFWINLYNGYTQAALKSNPEKYKNRNKFFKTKAIEVAGAKYSLDDIEHDFLRHSKIKWSLGYLSKLFPSKKEKQLRVQELDYRIHFALNCGAKSCPPIAFYNSDDLERQLDLATKAFLTGESEIDSSKNIIYVPKLMSWFRNDFGGKRGMLRILRKNGIIIQKDSPKIKFKKYDWSLTLNNYSNQ